MSSAADLLRRPSVTRRRIGLGRPRFRFSLLILFISFASLTLLLLSGFPFMRLGFWNNERLVAPWPQTAAIQRQLHHVRIPFADDADRDDSFSYDIREPTDTEDFCRGVDVVVLIASRPDAFEVRERIRLSWANAKNIPSNVLLRFIVGSQWDPALERHIQSETTAFGDIVRYAAQDAYRQLFVKSHAAIKWSLRFCPTAPLIAKVDDDAVLHLRRIGAMAREFLIATENATQRAAFCNVRRGEHPFRNPFSKLYVPFSAYTSWTWPDYCQGGAYMLTRGAASAILSATAATPLIALEDVLFTGVIGDSVGLRRIPSAAFCAEEDDNVSKCSSNGRSLVAAKCGINRQYIDEEWESLKAVKCSATRTQIFQFNSLISTLTSLFFGLQFLRSFTGIFQ